MTNLPLITAIISFCTLAALVATVCEMMDVRDDMTKALDNWIQTRSDMNKMLARLKKAEATLMALTVAHNITAEELEAIAKNVKDGIDDGK